MSWEQAYRLARKLSIRSGGSRYRVSGYRVPPVLTGGRTAQWFYTITRAPHRPRS